MVAYEIEDVNRIRNPIYTKAYYIPDHKYTPVFPTMVYSRTAQPWSQMLNDTQQYRYRIGIA